MELVGTCNACIDPATEVQAAGRIHRLGQTKDVLIKRFAFRDSLDERVCKLHTEIVSGRIKTENETIPVAGIRILAGSV